MKAVILAAGYATRLYPLTKDKPKALLRVGDKNLIDHIVDHLDAVSGLDELVVVTNERFYTQFKDWAEGAEHPFKITVLNDGTDSNDNRLGALGDLQFAVQNANLSGDLLVLASDNLFEQSLADFVTDCRKNGSDSAAIGVYDIGDKSIAAGRYGIISFDEKRRIQEIQEKPQDPKTSFVSMGVYFFGADTLRLIDEYMQSDAKQDAPGHYMTWLLNKTTVYASLFSGKWYDIGSIDQLEEASAQYK